jgi:hypothetical protein
VPPGRGHPRGHTGSGQEHDDAASPSRTLPSWLAVAGSRPSGANATAATGEAWTAIVPGSHLPGTSKTNTCVPAATASVRPSGANASSCTARRCDEKELRLLAIPGSGYRGDPFVYWLPGREPLLWPGNNAGEEEKQAWRERCAEHCRTVRERPAST